MALPYTYCTRIGLGFLAEACGKRGPASNTATDARAIGDDVAEFSGGRPNRASLVFGRSMLRFNDCLFRLGDIGLGPCRKKIQSPSLSARSIPACRRMRTSKPRPMSSV